MDRWGFLTSHARVLLCIGHDPGVRWRDIAPTVGITERRAYAIVTDLAEAGYLVKERDGRRNRYHIQAHLTLRESVTRERTIGEALDLLVTATEVRQGTDPPSQSSAGLVPGVSGGGGSEPGER